MATAGGKLLVTLVGGVPLKTSATGEAISAIHPHLMEPPGRDARTRDKRPHNRHNGQSEGQRLLRRTVLLSPVELHVSHKGTDGKTSLQCRLCDKVFSRRSNLRTHLFAHAGVKRYACGVCDKKFAHNKTLVVHSRTHTGERPFECTSCPATFTSREIRRRTHDNSHRRKAPRVQPLWKEICQERKSSPTTH
ncbi:hypothetical protein MTO96_044052 [Rhipicephalus appendiculatus]